jgi:hypothetical protein
MGTSTKNEKAGRLEMTAAAVLAIKKLRYSNLQISDDVLLLTCTLFAG